MVTAMPVIIHEVRQSLHEAHKAAGPHPTQVSSEEYLDGVLTAQAHGIKANDPTTHVSVQNESQTRHTEAVARWPMGEETK